MVCMLSGTLPFACLLIYRAGVCHLLLFNSNNTGQGRGSESERERNESRWRDKSDLVMWPARLNFNLNLMSDQCDLQPQPQIL